MSLEIRESITPGNEKSFGVGKRTRAAGLSELPAVHHALLGKDVPVTATLATVGRNGRPQLTPVWFSHDGTHVSLNSARGRVKDRNLRKARIASLLVVNPENPYHWLAIDGEVEGVIDEDDPERGHLATENADAHSEKYMGVRPYPLRDPKGEVRVLYKVRPTKILTFGPLKG